MVIARTPVSVCEEKRAGASGREQGGKPGRSGRTAAAAQRHVRTDGISAIVDDDELPIAFFYQTRPEWPDDQRITDPYAAISNRQPARGERGQRDGRNERANRQMRGAVPSGTASAEE